MSRAAARRTANKLSDAERVDVLPFHQMGRFKWKQLGLEYALEDTEPPTFESIAVGCEIFTNAGLLAY